MAWWLAALDSRIRVCVDICCLTDFEALIESDGLGGHGFYYYVPALMKYFSTSTINEVISPRAHLALAGRHDPLTPELGLLKIDDYLKAVYRKNGNPDGWQLKCYDVAHQETFEMRKAAIDFINLWL